MRLGAEQEYTVREGNGTTIEDITRNLDAILLGMAGTARTNSAAQVLTFKILIDLEVASA